MTDHPITPPPELVQQWFQKWSCDESIEEVDSDIYIATRAAQWGADQELKACCEWLQHDYPNIGANALRAARRPKPLSLKEQALAALLHLDQGQHNERCLIIRRALEALPE